MTKKIVISIASMMLSTMVLAGSNMPSGETLADVKEYKCTVPKPANRNHVPDHHSCG
jgi:hypothetical protein